MNVAARRLLLCLLGVAFATCGTQEVQAQFFWWRNIWIPNDSDHIARRGWLPEDGRLNRNGRNPQRERILPMRRIADPALLDPANPASKVPAITAAAEIKQQEDLKGQKLKAIRYLATIGCGCYNADGKITAALIAAMEDCTEEVRLAAVQAVKTAASGGHCQHCSQRSCCSPKILNKLSEIAYEKDDEGCPIEPSLRVRQAAIEAMQVCCPCPQPAFIPQYPLVEPTLEVTPDPTPVETVPPVTPVKPGFEGASPITPSVDGALPPAPLPEKTPPAEVIPQGAFLAPPPQTTSTDEVPYLDFNTPNNAALEAALLAVATPTELMPVPVAPRAPVTAANPVPPNLVPASSTSVSPSTIQAYTAQQQATRTASHVGGKVADLNFEQGTVSVQLPANVTLGAGTRLLVYHRYNLGRVSTSCELIVVSSRDNMAIARPTSAAAFAKVALGDTVTVVR